MCVIDCKYLLIEEVREQRRLLTLAIEKAEKMLNKYKKEHENEPRRG